MVGCSENIIKIPDQQPVVHLSILLAGPFIIIPVSKLVD